MTTTPNSTLNDSASPRKRVIFTAVSLFILFVGGLALVKSGVVSPQNVREVVADSGDSKYALFFLAVALGTCIHIPSNLFIIAGAILFGAPLGAALTLSGGTAGAVIQFTAIRHLIGGWKRSEFVSPSIQKALAAADKHPWRTVFALRLCFHLSALVSAGLSSTRVRFTPYFWGTLIGAAPLVLLFSVLATSLEAVFFP